MTVFLLTLLTLVAGQTLIQSQITALQAVLAGLGCSNCTAACGDPV